MRGSEKKASEKKHMEKTASGKKSKLNIQCTSKVALYKITINNTHQYLIIAAVYIMEMCFQIARQL